MSVRATVENDFNTENPKQSRLPLDLTIESIKSLLK